MATQVVRFCHDNEAKSGLSAAVAEKFPREANQVILNSHQVSLMSLKIDVKHVMGCAHDKEKCALCHETTQEEDPFLDVKLFEAERRTVLYFEVVGRQTARDAITWLMAHKEWLRAYNLKWYFYNHYDVVMKAMNDVNALGPIQLNGQIMYSMADGGAFDALEQPVYCCWMIRPRSLKAAHFYVPTKVPTSEVIFDYLSIMLGIGHEFTEQITHATIESEEHVERVSKRRVSVQKPLISPRAQDAVEGVERDDPRRPRADRLEKRSDLRDAFNVQNPRLMFIATDARVDMLEARPDYIFKPHHQYINVFYISLPEKASKRYDAKMQEKW